MATPPNTTKGTPTKHPSDTTAQGALGKKFTKKPFTGKP